MSEIEEKGERSKETTEVEVKIVDPETQVNGKRIAKNTLLLYVRMIVIMLISLYTSRVVLRVLGVEDFGIYNVVGGVVSVLSLMTASIGSSIIRFLTYELGTGNKEKLQRIFSTAINIQLVFSAIAIIIAETIGLWFLYNKMNIPAERMDAAFWVFQLSLTTFVISLINVPFHASILSHERMGVYAFVSIGEAVVRLLCIISLSYITWDKLICYAAILVALGVVVRIVYGIYCSRNFAECRYTFHLNRELAKEMFSFAGWNMFGSGSYLLMTQGVNMLINIYFDVIMNAARGIACQVEHSIATFYNNFTQALNPQITKQIAQKEYAASNKLIATGSKTAFYLALMMGAPICIEMSYVLKLWLGEVPEITTYFAQLAIVSQLISVVSIPLITAMLASGRIRNYQIIVGGIGLMVFPISWLLLDMGMGPETPYIVVIVCYIFQLAIRLYMLIDLVKFDAKGFIVNVLLRCCVVCLLTFIAPLVISYLMEEGFLRLVFVVLASTASLIVAVYAFGLNGEEREYMIRVVKSKLGRK